MVVPAVGDAGPDVQVLSERAGLPGTITLDGETVRSMLGLLQGARIDDQAYVTDVSLSEDDAGLEVTMSVGPEPREGVAVEEVKRELYTRLTARPDTEVRLVVDQPPVRRLLARPAPVPGFGWSRFAAAPLDHPVRLEVDDDTSVTLTNDLVTVVVPPGDGTFSLDGLPGYGRLVDGGDHGDTYNYSPPTHDTVVDTPTSVDVTAGERGPVRAPRWTSPPPTHGPGTSTATRTRRRRPRRRRRHHPRAAGRRAVRPRAHPLGEPGAGPPAPCPPALPSPAATSEAECAFTVVERGLTAEGRPEEFGLPTFPSRRFVRAGGLTVVHEGLLEYELVDIDERPDGRVRRH